MVTIKEGMSLLAIQNIFNLEYPYLKLGFFRNVSADHRTNDKIILKPDLLVRNKVVVPGDSDLIINDEMTVSEVEQLFKEHFGLRIQIFRKSGKTWLETKLTNDWSLQKQNNEGFELRGIM